MQKATFPPSSSPCQQATKDTARAESKLNETPAPGLLEGNGRSKVQEQLRRSGAVASVQDHGTRKARAKLN
eukprot:1137900-Pelagomonas_calceolata.AAC.4